MGQLRLVGADAAAALETLVPVDVVGLGVGKQRYALFTNDAGGILDDLMVTRRARPPVPGRQRRAARTPTSRTCARTIGQRCRIEPLPDHALLALQGPQAAAALARLAPERRAAAPS